MASDRLPAGGPAEEAARTRLETVLNGGPFHHRRHAVHGDRGGGLQRGCCQGDGTDRDMAGRPQLGHEGVECEPGGGEGRI